MYRPRRWPLEAWIPIAAGLAWLAAAAHAGWLGTLVALLPGSLLLSSGMSAMIWGGDVRIPQMVALGGVLGAVLALPFAFSAGPIAALGLLGISVACFVAAGGLALQLDPPVEEVPEPDYSLRMATQVALDEALLASIHLLMPMPLGGAASRVRQEVDAARELFHESGWLDDPADYHRTPPPLKEPRIVRAESRGLSYERLRFESEYTPHIGEPGRERWLAYAANHTAHAWVLRHAGAPRPWLVCIHGYQMGSAAIDLLAFGARELHERHGLNLIFPVLPLHGERKMGRRSGDGFLSGDLLDTVHAEAQAMWDIRRLLTWVRAQEPPAVGAFGLSLGGYTTALLTGLDDELALVIAGIPPIDVQRLIWRHAPPLALRQAHYEGLTPEAANEVLAVISPLALVPRVPREGRVIFGGVADRWVPPEHVRDLWRHWEQPRIVWYQGAHFTFRIHPAVRELLHESFEKLAGS